MTDEEANKIINRAMGFRLDRWNSQWQLVKEDICHYGPFCDTESEAWSTVNYCKSWSALGPAMEWAVSKADSEDWARRYLTQGKIRKMYYAALHDVDDNDPSVYREADTLPRAIAYALAEAIEGEKDETA